MKRVKGEGQLKTPQSAPPVKRKKLTEELDEELSDVDFEVKCSLPNERLFVNIARMFLLVNNSVL